MLSDAPAHHLFCLLPPVPPTQNSLPEVLAVVQVRDQLVAVNCSIMYMLRDVEIVQRLTAGYLPSLTQILDYLCLILLFLKRKRPIYMKNK